MAQRTVLQRSINTERALSSVRPRLRGRSHLIAALVAVPGVPVWVAMTPSGTRLGVAAFGLGIAVMLVFSALLHLKPWDGATYERLFRLDHTGIYAAISGTAIGVGVLGLDGWPGVVLIVAAAGGGLLGVIVEWLPFAPPRGFSNTVYLSLGWLPMLLLPWLWTGAGPAAVALLLIGGAFYTVGAVMVALQRPDPWPRWFGYHELWHLFVLIAAGTHGLLIARLASGA